MGQFAWGLFVCTGLHPVQAAVEVEAAVRRYEVEEVQRVAVVTRATGETP